MGCYQEVGRAATVVLIILLASRYQPRLEVRDDKLQLNLFHRLVRERRIGILLQ